MVDRRESNRNPSSWVAPSKRDSPSDESLFFFFLARSDLKELGPLRNLTRSRGLFDLYGFHRGPRVQVYRDPTPESLTIEYHRDGTRSTTTLLGPTLDTGQALTPVIVMDPPPVSTHKYGSRVKVQSSRRFLGPLVGKFRRRTCRPSRSRPLCDEPVNGEGPESS